MSIITLATVKTTVAAADMVEVRKLGPYYISAERTLNRILGDTVNTRIVAAAASPGTDVPADTLIADYLTGFLSWFTWHRALPVLYAEPDKNGIHYKADANNIQADASFLNKIMKVAADMSDQYQGDLIAYMEKNSDTGEEWAAYRTDTDTVNDDSRISKTYAGIVTKRSRWQNPPDMRWSNYGRNRNSNGEICE